MEKLNQPNLIVFLKSDVNINIERIKRRERECEADIDTDYLKNLH